MPRTFDSFASDLEHSVYLQRQEARGRLLPGTVTPEARSEMFEQVLAPDPNPGVYLEVGHGASPYIAGSSRRFGGEVRYLGIDGGISEYFWPTGLLETGHHISDLERRQAEISVANLGTDVARLMVGDAQSLDFPDAAHQPARQKIREIFMRDVLIDTRMHPRSVERIINEQARVLDPSGVLVIRETSLMGYHNHFGAEGALGARFLTLQASLKNAGFMRRTVVFNTDEDVFPRLRAQYPGGEDDRQTRDRMTDGYYVLAQRGTEGLIPSRSAFDRALKCLGFR